MAAKKKKVVEVTPEVMGDAVPAVPQIVQLLEDALARAKAGEIRSLGLSYVGIGGFATSAYHLGEHRFTVIGATAWLQKRMLEHQDPEPVGE